MIWVRRLALFLAFSVWLPRLAEAEPGLNKSVQSQYKTMAHFCVAGRCDDQDETLNSSFFIGPRDVHIYAGANKGLVLPFGRRHVSATGTSVWMTPTSAGFDESYARDGFTITHHYAVHPDGTCSVSVAVVRAPAAVAATYRTEMGSCRVTEGNAFAAQ